MRNSERRQQCRVAVDRREPAMPDVYLPAMWPVGLQQIITDWYKAWRKRCLYRRLLTLSDRQLRSRDLSRPRLRERAALPLRQIVAEQRRRRCHERAA